MNIVKAIEVFETLYHAGKTGLAYATFRELVPGSLGQTWAVIAFWTRDQEIKETCKKALETFNLDKFGNRRPK